MSATCNKSLYGAKLLQVLCKSDCLPWLLISGGEFRFVILFSKILSFCPYTAMIVLYTLIRNSFFLVSDLISCIPCLSCACGFPISVFALRNSSVCCLQIHSFLLFVYKFLILNMSVSPYSSYSSLCPVCKFFLSDVLSHSSDMTTPLQHVSFHTISFIFAHFLNSILHLFAHIYFQISKKLI